jgi:hypothetical protein
MHMVMKNELSFPALKLFACSQHIIVLLRYLLRFISVGMNLTFVNSAVRVILDCDVINIS